MSAVDDSIRRCADATTSRLEMWIELLCAWQVHRMAEIGVYRGEFAARVLAECGSIEAYYMIDPWRHLDDWNKPANTDDRSFEDHYNEAMRATEFAAAKRTVLRGTTAEVIDQIPDASLDFAYIDGDHTLRGITIDLVRVLPKVRVGGWIGGDDFTPTIFQHSTRYEPTMVFPQAVYFAEAVGAPIYALPHDQFLIERKDGESFDFTDLTGRYGDTELRRQFRPGRLLWTQFVDTIPIARRILAKAKQLVSRPKPQDAFNDSRARTGNSPQRTTDNRRRTSQ